MTDLKRHDWLLLVLWAAGGKPLSPVQLQKTLFLLGQNAPNLVGEDFYTFIPYDYGPFDSSIYTDAESLQAEGVVSISAPSGQRWKDYVLTHKGTEKATTLAGSLDSQARDYLAKLVQWVLRLDFNTLLRWVYSKHPAYSVNSVFRG